MADKTLRAIKFPDLPDTYYVPDYYDSAYVENEASGNIVSFNDGANDVPVKSLIASIEPVQAGTGDPSPDNIRPITGWTGARVTKTGKNLLNDNARYISSNSQTVVFGQTVSTSFQNTFLKAGTYTFSVKCDDTQRHSCYFKRLGDSANTSLWLGLYGSQSATFTLDKDTWIAIWIYNNSGIDTEKDIFAQIESGSTATEYEPYQGEIYDITFPSEAGTVYGGYVDVTNGKLVVDRAYDSMTYTWLSSLPSSYIGVDANKVWVRNWNYNKAASLRPGGINAISNMYSISMHNKSKSSTQYRIYFLNADSVNALLNSVQTAENEGNGLFIAYELATPVTYDITPQQISTLLGENNIWADTGDTEVTYRADAKIYIDNVLGSEEDDMIADNNIESGKVFFVGNRLYVATTAITTGQTIIPGENCRATTISEQINALYALNA